MLEKLENVAVMRYASLPDERATAGADISDSGGIGSLNYMDCKL